MVNNNSASSDDDDSNPARGSDAYEAFILRIRATMHAVTHTIFPDIQHWEFALAPIPDDYNMGDVLYSLMTLANESSTMINFKEFIIFTNTIPDSKVMHYIDANAITLSIEQFKNADDPPYIGIAAGGVKQLASNNPN